MEKEEWMREEGINHEYSSLYEATRSLQGKYTGYTTERLYTGMYIGCKYARDKERVRETDKRNILTLDGFNVIDFIRMAWRRFKHDINKIKQNIEISQNNYFRCVRVQEYI